MKKLIIITVLIFVLSVPVFASGEGEALDESLEGSESFSFLSCTEIIEAVLKNEQVFDGESFWENILEVFFLDFKAMLPTLVSVLAVSILISFAQSLKLLSPETEPIALMGGKAIIAVILTKNAVKILNGVSLTMNSMQSFTSVLSPILISLLATSGLSGSVSSLAPDITLLSNVLVTVANTAILPVLSLGTAVSCVNGALKDSRLSGVKKILFSSAAWIMGATFTVFSATVTIHGFWASTADGVSVRSIKYALSSSVPVIGGNVSESFSTVLTGCITLKNAVGISGVIALLCILLLPLLNIIAYIFALKLVSAFVLSLGCGEIAGCIDSASDFIKLAAALLLGCIAIWFVFMAIIIKAGGGLL